MTILQANAALVSLFVLGLTLGANTVGMVESWRMGGPGSRREADAAFALRMTASMGSATIPMRMSKNER